VAVPARGPVGGAWPPDHRRPGRRARRRGDGHYREVAGGVLNEDEVGGVVYPVAPEVALGEEHGAGDRAGIEGPGDCTLRNLVWDVVANGGAVAHPRVHVAAAGGGDPTRVSLDEDLIARDEGRLEVGARIGRDVHAWPAVEGDLRGTEDNACPVARSPHAPGGVQLDFSATLNGDGGPRARHGAIPLV